MVVHSYSSFVTETVKMAGRKISTQLIHSDLQDQAR
jgi:hypothetical protein